MQNTEKERVAQDQVILVMDQTSNKPKQSSENALDAMNATHPEKPTPSNPSAATATRTLRRLKLSKPKSRFVEIPHPTPLKTTVIIEPPEDQEATKPFFSSDSEEEDEEDDELSKEDYEQLNDRYRQKKRKVGRRAIFEFSSFVVIMACLVCSLTIGPTAQKRLWDILLWKWCLIILVTFSGRLVSAWLVGLAVFFIERYFMLREKVLYFVYGLRKSVQKCVWLGLVLLAWFLMFNHEVKAATKPHYHQLLDKLWRALIAIMVGNCVWLLKIVLVKVLASSFHVATFFDRMKESVFHHYILETLSGPPIDDLTMEVEKKKTVGVMRRSKTMPARMKKMKEGGLGESRRIDMEKLKRLSRRKASGWSVRRLVSHVTSSGLSTISRTVDRTVEEFGEAEGEISSEWEARVCAERIFKNVAREGEK